MILALWHLQFHEIFPIFRWDKNWMIRNYCVFYATSRRLLLILPHHCDNFKLVVEIMPTTILKIIFLSFFRMMKHGIIMQVQLRCVLYHNLCKAKLWAKNTRHITWRTASQSIWQFVKCQSLPFVPPFLTHFVSNIRACKFHIYLKIH